MRVLLLGWLLDWLRENLAADRRTGSEDAESLRMIHRSGICQRDCFTKPPDGLSLG
jgi:hypothetical protein